MDHPDRQTEKGLWFKKEAEGGRKRSEIKVEEFAVYDRVCRNRP
jgi:hypothetical protein